jgi:hypothetical protein
MTPNETRRKILRTLYDNHRENSQSSMESSELIRRMGVTDLTEFWEDVQHLHDEEYIDGTPVPFQRPGFLERASLTPRGISLMDNPAELDRLFPLDLLHVVVEGFLRDMRLEFEKSEMSDDEKEQLFLCLERLAGHPVAASLMSRVLQRLSRK